MLEEIIQPMKDKIDQTAKSDKAKIDFLAKLFTEYNSEIKEIIEKEDMPLKQAYNQLRMWVANIGVGQISIQPKTNTVDINNILPVKIGIYNVKGGPENYFLEPTEKGKKIDKEYSKL